MLRFLACRAYWSVCVRCCLLVRRSGAYWSVCVRRPVDVSSDAIVDSPRATAGRVLSRPPRAAAGEGEPA